MDKKMRKEIKIGQRCSEIMYSDVNPYEVVEIISEKKIKVRSMNAELDKAFNPEIIAGGFAGHCVNQRDQKWIITSNPNGAVITLTLRKSGKFRPVGAKDSYGSIWFDMSGARKLYDYNF